MSLRVVLVGYGRMGKEIESLCDAYDCEIVERLDIHNNLDGQGINSDQPRSRIYPAWPPPGSTWSSALQDGTITRRV